MRHHDFDAEAADAAGEPITFTLGGVTFICRQPFPIGALVEFAERASEIEELAETDGRRNLRALAAQDRLLRAVITEDQHDAWRTVVAAQADLTVFERVIRFVVGEATGRPTSAPSSSPASVDGAGQSSTGA